MSSFLEREILELLFSPPEPKAKQDDIDVAVVYNLQKIHVHLGDVEVSLFNRVKTSLKILKYVKK